MTVTEQPEQARHRLHSELAETLSAQSAGLLMSYLPPVGWADVATKRDLDVLATELRSEIVGVRTDLQGEMHAQFADVRTEMRTEFARVRTEIADVRGEVTDLRGEVADLRGEVRTGLADVRVEMSSQLRALFFSQAGLGVALVGLTFAAARLG